MRMLVEHIDLVAHVDELTVYMSYGGVAGCVPFASTSIQLFAGSLLAASDLSRVCFSAKTAINNKHNYTYVYSFLSK